MRHLCVVSALPGDEVALGCSGYRGSSPRDSTSERDHAHHVAGAAWPLVGQAARRCGRLWPSGGGAPCCWPSDCRLVDTRAYPRTARDHSPNLSDPTGAQSSQSSTIPVTLCKAMYFSAVMKVSPSRGSCTSRWHPHFSHASGSHWRGSELVVMPASSQPAAAYSFGRIGQLPGSWRDHRG